VKPARDADGYERILLQAACPLERLLLELHAAGLRARASREGVAFGRDLAVQSVYELAEPLDRLVPDRASHPVPPAA
jgi:glutamate mutase epsilon subunit